MNTLDEGRKRRLCYWDPQSNSFGGTKLHIERHLKFLPNFDLQHLSSLEDPAFQPCDLLLVSANSFDSDEFRSWLKGLNSRILKNNAIWTPAIIFSDLDFSELSQDLHTFADNNWYFDIIHSEHLSSMPIRVANLLRIHDHMHELWRYQKQLDTMQQQVEDIERRLLQPGYEDK